MTTYKPLNVSEPTGSQRPFPKGGGSLALGV